MTCYATTGPGGRDPSQDHCLAEAGCPEPGHEIPGETTVEEHLVRWVPPPGAFARMLVIYLCVVAVLTIITGVILTSFSAAA